jgi:hypothetical protein
MSRPREEYIQEIIEVIMGNENIVSNENIFSKYPGCSIGTYYRLKLNECESIKEALNYNRYLTLSTMQNNWKKETAAPALQMGAYKLMCSDKDRMKLNMSFVAHTDPDGRPLDLIGLPMAELLIRLEECRRLGEGDIKEIEGGIIDAECVEG